MHRHAHGHGILCIVPPHMLQSIAARAQDEETRAAALAMLDLDASLRRRRATTQFLQRTQPASAPAVVPHRNRLLYTTDHTTTLPGSLVRSEGQGPSGDAAVDEAYDGFGATFDLLWEQYNRNSIDGAGMDILGTTHYSQGYDNAFWNGSQMVFGDGDGTYFNRFTLAIDVIGHELTHGVTGHQANLVYHDQPGALNESISDAFGSVVKQWSRHEDAASADWLIGEGLFTPRVNGTALRSMKAPGTAYDDPVLGKDPQPADMSGYVSTAADNGGVHTNSGIPNHAFYLAALSLGGHAWEKAGRIWYQTVCDPRLTSTAQFQDFADLTADNAGSLFGTAKHDAVADAWRQVGIDVGAAGGAPRPGAVPEPAGRVTEL